MDSKNMILMFIYIYIYMDSKNMILMFKGNLNSTKNYELIWTGLLPLRQERRVFVWIAFEMEKHNGPGYFSLPLQFCPSPLNPGLQTHLKDPSELSQVALSLLQLQVILKMERDIS